MFPSIVISYGGALWHHSDPYAVVNSPHYDAPDGDIPDPPMLGSRRYDRRNRTSQSMQLRRRLSLRKR